uniref:Uncharacterized protein n=1 Tax=Kalanchoe fedtschenkoi TaxID=63787 RepID=A0A7N0UZY9_KALFE
MLWSHLSFLVRSVSKDSVEVILQILWRTRKTSLDDAERETIRNMLQLPDDSDLNPQGRIHMLFSDKVLAELRRFLTLLLPLKFQKNLHKEVMKD